MVHMAGVYSTEWSKGNLSYRDGEKKNGQQYRHMRFSWSDIGRAGILLSFIIQSRPKLACISGMQ